jgi:hypothetical protein
MGQVHFLEARMTEVNFHYSKQGALILVVPFVSLLGKPH